MLQQLRNRLNAPTDPASLAALRMLLGLLIVFAAVRTLLSGALQQLAADNHLTFRYPGWEGIPVATDHDVMVATIGFIGLGSCIALGLCFRLATLSYAALFAWVELRDLTNYLNHHYLLLLLALLLSASPAHACWSIDAAMRKSIARTHVPFFHLALLRFQVAIVYGFAAVAKVGADWLYAGQPLGLWLPAREGLPWMGLLLSVSGVPLLLSWCGLAYDATIVPLLMWQRTRPMAYVAVVVFHSLTWAFFDIGLFPFIMCIATTVFFSPSWPRRFMGQTTAAPADSYCKPVALPALALAALWCLFHVLFPLRCHLIGDDVLWDEAGMRWSWRVMVREKSGSLTYRITMPTPQGPRTVVASPHDRLTHRQVNEMSTQPDMILQLAHILRDDFAAKGVRVEVRADALVSLNGRRAQRFIDPEVDLATMDDTFFSRPTFVLPAPQSPAPRMP